MSSLTPYQTIKIVAVGDGGVGKTCMFNSYIGAKVNDEYTPTVFDNFETILCINNQPIKISLWDTAGQECYNRIRTLSYPRTDIFLVCYSIVEPSSYFHMLEKWIPEFSKICPQVPFIIVGLKSDLREDKEYVKNMFDRGFEPIPLQKAEENAREWGAIAYFECSAVSRDGLCELFEFAFMVALKKDPLLCKKKKRHCIIL